MIRRIIFVVLAGIVFSTNSLMSVNLAATEQQMKQQVDIGSTFSQAINEPKAINAIFPDIALAEAIRVALNKETITSTVRQQNLDTMREFVYANPAAQVQSIDGIEYLRNVTTLDLSGNAIKDIRVLSNMTQLQKLVLAGNKIEDLHPLSTLTQLESLHLNANNIADISPLKPLTSLKETSLADQTIYDYALLTVSNGPHAYAYCRARDVNGKIISLTGRDYNCTFGPHVFFDNVPAKLTEEITREKNWQHETKIGEATTIFSGVEIVTIFPKRRIIDIFPDPVLAEVMRVALNNRHFYGVTHKESVEDFVTGNELRYVKSLTWRYPPQGQKIKSVEGIARLFVSDMIDFSGNEITDIGAFLGAGPGKLILRDNNIRDLSPFVGGGSLHSLDLSNNFIEDITPFLHRTSLPYEVILDGNFISDISSLPHAKWGTLLETVPSVVTISLKNQKPLEQLLHTVPIIHRNQIRHFDNTLVTPNIISDNGRYDSENIIWETLPDEQKATLHYAWKEDIAFPTMANIKEVRGEFSGSYSIQVIKGYTLKFMFERHDYIEPQQVLPQELLRAPARPQKREYTFIGWYTEEEGGSVWDFASDTMPEADLTLYARFVRNLYTVIYDNGISKERQEAAPGGLLVEPERPRQPGKSFIGWFTDPLRGRQWNFAMDIITEDEMTLYARFLISRYTVVYYNALGAAPPQQRLPYGSHITQPADPIAEGYRFLGWFNAPVGGKRWDFIHDTMSDNNVNLYARWEKLI